MKRTENTAANYFSRQPSEIDYDVNNEGEHFERHFFYTSNQD